MDFYGKIPLCENLFERDFQGNKRRFFSDFLNDFFIFYIKIYTCKK